MLCHFEIWSYVMLCYDNDMMCYVMLCHFELCYVRLGYAML